jgi:hypothetical protein
MGWSIGYDSNWKRDIGYGVPAYCDYPGCAAKIDRGLSYVCGGAPYGGDGCGLFFCEEHMGYSERLQAQCCDRCVDGDEPFNPSSDHPEWIRHKLTHESWAEWRKENPDSVARLATWRVR